MTREDIISMALGAKAKVSSNPEKWDVLEFDSASLEGFARLIAANTLSNIDPRYDFSDPAPVCWTADHAINMTIRDHFAAMAMKYMGLPTKVSYGRIGDNTWSLEDMENFPFTEMSRVAYRWADAMMKARKNND